MPFRIIVMNSRDPGNVLWHTFETARHAYIVTTDLDLCQPIGVAGHDSLSAGSGDESVILSIALGNPQGKDCDEDLFPFWQE